MTPEPEDGQLEQLLAARDAYIEDAGFTRRVLQALPPPRAASGRTRSLILLCATALAGLVALWLLPGGQVLDDACADLVSYQPFVSDLPLVSLALVTLAVCGGLAAISTER